MAQRVILNPRDLALLRLLDAAPLTAVLIRRASVTFGEEPFRDERRVRERMQALCDAGLVRSWSGAVGSGGLVTYYRLTAEGHRVSFPDAAEAPPRISLQEIAPSRLRHTMATAEILVHTLVACRERGVAVQRVFGDGRLVLEIGEHRQQPDFHVQLGYAGRTFNFVFEIDNATEPLDSHREQSIRTKIAGYEAYQEWVLELWEGSNRDGPRPGFRVVFLTTGAERALHILALARELSRDRNRRLVYAAPQDAYLGDRHAVTEPILTDRFGYWQALVNAQPSSRFLRDPVRIVRPFVPPPGV